MNISRRSFLGGSLSLGAFAGCRAFRAPAGLFAGEGARLTLGVVSDIHVDCGHGDFKKFGDTAQFVKALHWFDAEGVDGVVVAGDMADNGMINQLECVGEAWFKVFPDGRSLRDGRDVAQLFVYGNHDLEGQDYDQFGYRYFEKKSFEAGKIRPDPAAAWEHVFHEKYEPIWLKEVKGYQFIGAHWTKGKDAWGGIPEVEPWFKANAAKIDRTKPFFFIQHCHPKDTVYGDEAWCPDRGYATRALSQFPNAVAFSGHTHNSLTDERSIWQGAFTSIGTSSLRYGGGIDRWEQRQGMLLKVYDDRIVIARRDFLHDASLGDDWVIPLGPTAGKPFTFEARKAKSSAPQFPAGAKITVKPFTEGENRKQKDGKTVYVSESGWYVTIPCANAGKTRVVRYEVDAGVKDAKGKDAKFIAWASGYNMPRSMEGGALTKKRISANDLAKGAVPTFTVRALDSFGNASEPIKS